MKIFGLATTLIASLVLALPASADGFTSADVLEWSETSQNSLFQTSVNMIGIVATRTGEHEHIAECIDAWHGGAVVGAELRADQIREKMVALPDYHPQVIIQAVIEEQCGDF